MAGLLYADHIQINEKIAVAIPRVGEILDNEDSYFSVVSAVVSTPYDMMVQLDDAGIDFTKINDFELFCLMFGHLQENDTHLVFGDLDLSKYQTATNRETKELLLLNVETGDVIDRPIHNQICTAIRSILRMEKVVKHPANEEARKYMIQRARVKQKSLMRKQKANGKKSQLEDIIVGLVNTSEFPYDYQSVRDISIYQLYASLHQVTHKIRYDKNMIGYYAGTVKLEDLKQEDRSWLVA